MSVQSECFVTDRSVIGILGRQQFSNYKFRYLAVRGARTPQQQVLAFLKCATANPGVEVAHTSVISGYRIWPIAVAPMKQSEISSPQRAVLANIEAVPPTDTRGRLLTDLHRSLWALRLHLVEVGAGSHRPVRQFFRRDR
jgi:hypothetical protein